MLRSSKSGEADAIDPADLTGRLQVPRNADELSRLALTFNSMLARIETGYRSVEQFTADASHELRAPLALIITVYDLPNQLFVRILDYVPSFTVRPDNH